MSPLLLVGYALALACAIMLSAMFSGAETGFLSLNKMKLRALLTERDKSARKLNTLIKDPEHYLASILVGNNIAVVCASSLATYVAVDLWGEMGSTVATIMMTLIIVQFCEIFPKELFRQYPDRLMYKLVGVITFFNTVLSPIAKLFSSITRVFSSLLNLPTKRKKIPFVTREEMTMLIREGEEKGTLEEHERDMIHSIIEFRDTKAGEVKVPLTDVVAIDYAASIDELLKLIQTHGYTRFPVFKERVDNIVGVVNVFDFLYKNVNTRKWQTFVRETYFVPEKKTVSLLIRELQKKHQKMAVVVNEYGSSIGIVTIEDMMEEIVGEIYDETDESDKPVRKISEGVYEIDGKAEVEFLNEEYNLKIPEGDYDTISGYIFEYLEKIPHEGEGIVTKNFSLTIKKMDKNRVIRVRYKRS